MHPLRTFILVRPPSMTTLMSALLMWTTWWLANQFGPIVLDIRIAPVSLAIFVATLFSICFRFPTVLRNLRRIRQSPLIAYAILFPVILALFYMLSCDTRAAQIVYTCAISLLGIVHFSFGLFHARTIQKTSADTTMPLYAYSGPYVISGLGLIGKAIMSALLIDHVGAAIWIFAVSIGALFYDFLLRWVSVLWLMTQQDRHG